MTVTKDEYLFCCQQAQSCHDIVGLAFLNPLEDGGSENDSKEDDAECQVLGFGLVDGVDDETQETAANHHHLETADEEQHELQEWVHLRWRGDGVVAELDQHLGDVDRVQAVSGIRS